jgi:aspartate aminotransferase
VGALYVVCPNPAITANVLDQLRAQIRWEVSSSLAWGAKLVNIILHDEDSTLQWKEELRQALRRIEDNRQTLYNLWTEKLKTPGEWENIIREKGLFSLLPLNLSQISELLTKHLYLPPNGQVNIAGLSSNNIQRSAAIIDKVARS